METCPTLRGHLGNQVSGSRFLEPPVLRHGIVKKLRHPMAHGHTWGLLPACSPKGEEHIRKLLCRNRLRGLSWKGTSQSRLFATASKQPACPQSGHEPYLFSASFTVVDEPSHSSFHRFLQTSEIISVLGHIKCACLLKWHCDLMVRHRRTFCGRIPAVKPMSVTWRHSPSIFLLFLDSHQHWIWIVSRCMSRQFSSIFIQHLSPLDAHDVEQRGHESTVAISAPLLISRLVGEVSRSNY